MSNRRYRVPLTMIRAALCLVLAYVLPFLTGQIPTIGAMLCPMHLPVLLCGFLCGWQWGLTVGAVAPLIRSLTLGVPIWFPNAICMALELAAYGAISGLLYLLLSKKRGGIYISMLTAMLFGRLLWGASMFVLVGLRGGSFGFSAFLAGAFINAIPGIILQIVLIPVIVRLVTRKVGK